MKVKLIFSILICASVSACATHTSLPFQITPIAKLDEPWAMTFLPSGKLLVSEKGGRLRLVSQKGDISQPIENTPDVAYGGQGGLGDVILHPNYSENRQIYLSYAESDDDGNYGAVVISSKLSISEEGLGTLNESKVIWKQLPKVSGRGHYGHRLAFDSNGYLFISSGI